MEAAVFDDLVSLSEPKETEIGNHFSLKLNPNHAVFKGHFPERAILPGVVMIEILKKATQKIIGKSLSMKESKSIKFLRMVEPQLTEELDLTLTIKEDENGIHVRGALAKNEDIYFKEIVTFIGA